MISLWDVLKASKGLPVSDFYAAMWGKQIAGKYTIAELEGALPLTFNANGEALIDYRIYGNTEQTGTPTPENPVDAVGCGVRTENLINPADVTPLRYVNSNGTLAPASNWSVFYVPVSAGETYTCSGLSTVVSNAYIGYCDSQKNIIGIVGNAITTAAQAVTAPVNAAYLAISKHDGSDRPMCVLGSTAPSSYIPYGYKLPLISAGQTTNIYLGEMQTTRRIKKLVLTGEELWTVYQTSYYIKVNNYYRMYDVGSHLSICSHYPIAQLYTIPEMHYGLGGLIDGQTDTRWNGNIVFNPSPTISSQTDWQSYLAQQYAAGTPVTVWYVLDEPETAVVNEPLMKIGDYSDMVSMEQAGVSIPTNNGSTVIDYDGTLKPSQMYIKYPGVKK